MVVQSQDKPEVVSIGRVHMGGGATKPLPCCVFGSLSSFDKTSADIHTLLVCLVAPFVPLYAKCSALVQVLRALPDSKPVLAGVFSFVHDLCCASYSLCSSNLTVVS